MREECGTRRDGSDPSFRAVGRSKRLQGSVRDLCLGADSATTPESRHVTPSFIHCFIALIHCFVLSYLQPSILPPILSFILRFVFRTRLLTLLSQLLFASHSQRPVRFYDPFRGIFLTETLTGSSRSDKPRHRSRFLWFSFSSKKAQCVKRLSRLGGGPIKAATGYDLKGNDSSHVCGVVHETFNEEPPWRLVFAFRDE